MQDQFFLSAERQGQSIMNSQEALTPINESAGQSLL